MESGVKVEGVVRGEGTVAATEGVMGEGTAVAMEEVTVAVMESIVGRSGEE